MHCILHYLDNVYVQLKLDKKEGVCGAIFPKREVAVMEKNNRFIKLLLFPVGSDDYILLYGFSSSVEKKTRAWSQRKTHKARQIICTAILSNDEADRFEHDLTVPGKLTVGKVSFSSPQLVRRSTVLCYSEDQTESNPVGGCGQLTELWQIYKDSQLQKIKDTYKTEGKELYKDIQALLSWTKQECGIDLSTEGRRFGNFERYENSRFHNVFDIVFHKELGNKKITVKKVMPLTKDMTVNCVATHRGRQLINQIKNLRAGEHMLEFSADEPMSRVKLQIWESESGSLIFNNDITLITKICLDMNIGETPYRFSEPWSEKLLKSAANRREIIKGKIETVERNSFERRLNISSDTYDKIDVAMEEGNQLLSGYHQKQCQGAYIANVGNDGEKRAVDYLIENGYKILFRNWRLSGGEIDIIALKDDVLVFVEVKTLPNSTVDMLEKVLNKEKQKRIIKMSKRFLQNHREYINRYIRFDVIIIDMKGLPPIYHIENAFSESL